MAGLDVTDTTFTLESGTLPDGVYLIPDTGEIFGVPTEEGQFLFQVFADSDEPFYITYMLTIYDNIREYEAAYHLSSVGYFCCMYTGINFEPVIPMSPVFEWILPFCRWPIERFYAVLSVCFSQTYDRKMVTWK